MKPTLLLLSLVAIALISGTEASRSLRRLRPAHNNEQWGDEEWEDEYYEKKAQEKRLKTRKSTFDEMDEMDDDESVGKLWQGWSEERRRLFGSVKKALIAKWEARAECMERCEDYRTKQLRARCFRDC